MVRKNLLVFITLLLSGVFLLQGMQKSEIVVKIGDEQYPMTKEQALQSQVIGTLLRKGEQEPLDISAFVDENTFKYLYNDLTNKKYDKYALNIFTVNKLFNAARALKIDQLVEKYSKLAAEYAQEVKFLVHDVQTGENKEFALLEAQAKRSKTLKNLLESVETYDEPIPLIGLDAKFFKYIYKRLTNKKFDIAALSDEMIINLINAANYLDMPDFLKELQLLVAHRLSMKESFSQLKKILDLTEKLPLEMQYDIARILYTNTMQLLSSIESKWLIKLVSETDGWSYIAPDKTKYILQKNKAMVMNDVISNKILYQKEFNAEESRDYIFSSDSSQFIRFTPDAIVLYSALDGEKIWAYEISTSGYKIINFLSDIDRIIIFDVRNRNILIIDSTNGSLIGTIKTEIPYTSGKKSIHDYFFYDPIAKTVCIEERNPYNAVKLDLAAPTVRIIDPLNAQEIFKRNILLNAQSIVEILLSVRKIVTVSHNEISIENFDENEKYSWAFTRPLSALDVRIFWFEGKLVVVALKDKRIYMLDPKTGKTIWAEEIKITEPITLVKFIQEAQKLLVYTEKNSACFDLNKKRMAWIKKLEMPTKHIYDDSILVVSPSLFVLLISMKEHVIQLNSLLNGEKITSLSIERCPVDSFQLSGSFGSNFVLNRHCSTGSAFLPQFQNKPSAEQSDKFVLIYNCALPLFISNLASYGDLTQTVIAHYIVNAMHQKKFIFPEFITDFEDEIVSQEIKRLIEEYNSPQEIKKMIEEYTQGEEYNKVKTEKAKSAAEELKKSGYPEKLKESRTKKKVRKQKKDFPFKE